MSDGTDKNRGLNTTRVFIDRDRKEKEHLTLGQSTLLLGSLLHHGGILRGDGKPLELDAKPGDPRTSKLNHYFPPTGEGLAAVRIFETFPSGEFLPTSAPLEHGTKLKEPEIFQVPKTNVLKAEECMRHGLRATSQLEVLNSASAAYVETLFNVESKEQLNQTLEKIMDLNIKAAHTANNSIKWQTRSVVNSMLLRRDAALKNCKDICDKSGKVAELRSLPFHDCHHLFGDQIL
ncbi:MAG TPA: hypothetical protein VFT30_04260, partial [Nitrospira sp.]|nr:hypothetical protein [Nitrospira sp.]